MTIGIHPQRWGREAGSHEYLPGKKWLHQQAAVTATCHLLKWHHTLRKCLKNIEHISEATISEGLYQVP